jgi:hypothetical protein
MTWIRLRFFKIYKLAYVVKNSGCCKFLCGSGKKNDAAQVLKQKWKNQSKSAIKKAQIQVKTVKAARGVRCEVYSTWLEMREFQRYTEPDWALVTQNHNDK